MTTITTRYGHDTTAEEVARGIDLTGCRIIVTGAASGIGVETARALAGTGAEVTLAVRDLAAGERTSGEITETTGNSEVHVAHLDLADRASIAGFVAAWAGPAACARQQRRRDGVPRDAHARGLGAAVRHQPPRALRPRARTARGAGGRGAGRIVAVSSAAHRRSPVVFEDIHFERRDTTPGWPTASPRPPTSCSPSRRRAAGRTTASPPTRSCRAASRRTCSATWTRRSSPAGRRARAPAAWC